MRNTIEQLNLIKFSNQHTVPIIMQSEVSECGLAALAMIASYHGYKANISTFRNLVKIDHQGLSAKQLINLSSKIGLSSRAVRCDIKDIGNLKCPCILHWNLDHFVVLTEITRKYFIIHDPAKGRLELTYNEFNKCFTGISLEFFKNESFRAKDARSKINISNLWGKIYGLKTSLLSFFLLSLIIQGISLFTPYYMQLVVDNVLLSNDKPLLVVLAIGFSILHVFGSSVEALRAWLIVRFNAMLNIQIGSNLFHHLIGISIDYFTKRHIGDIISKFESMNEIKKLLTTGIVEALLDSIMTTLVLIMMFLYSSKLAVVTIVILLLFFIVKISFLSNKKSFTEEMIFNSAKEKSFFIETVRAIQTIKTFNHESLRLNAWLNKYANVINSEIKLSKLQIIEHTLQVIILGLENILIIYFGAKAIISNNLTIGMLLAFMSYKGQFIVNTSKLVDKVISFKLLGLYFDRLSDIVLTKRELEITTPKSNCFSFNEAITLENVSFKYSDNTKLILDDLSIKLPKGKIIVITGSSGGGKSTLLKLILGLIEPTDGSISIDGTDIRNINKEDYRRMFGCVMQEDTLLSGSLIENITMFDTKIDYEKVISCCKTACIWDDIYKLPLGLNSMVNEMGANFSGGQLQRIFLARALYKNPKILCLDESSSHLDMEKELLINNNIKKMGLTAIVISHRKETINFSDIVIEI